MLLNFCYKTVYSAGVIVFSILLGMCYLKNYVSELCCSSLQTLFCPSYDYIVVGAGSAGSIVAHRLAEDPKVRVLLIEAGPNSTSLLDVPLAGPLLQLSDYDWSYKTCPQKYSCYGLQNHESTWPMGRVVGGSSRLNYMMYVRGHSRDYDSWSEKGNTNWGFSEHALHFFRKSENQIGKYRDDYNYHSRRGPMIVSDLPFETPLADAILQGAHELDYRVGDLNGRNQTGFMKTQVNLHNGKRWSSEYGYLKSHRFRNLRILSNTIVSKVLFYSNFEANGVKVMRFGETIMFRATKGVILSAGTVGTPKILMRSGIGPREHLESLQIPVVQDLPVGKNLQDHITTGIDLIVLNQSLNLNLGDIFSPISLWKYFWHGKGPWTATGCEAFGLIHTSLVNPETDPPDIQLMALPFGVSSDYGAHVKNTMGIDKKVWEDYFLPLRGQQVASILPVLLHPKSHGEVHLRSKNPLDPPIINPNYLVDENDVKTLYEGILLVKKLIQTEAFQKLGARLYDSKVPGCEEFDFDSPSYWKCYIRHITLTSYHPVGTCRMGPKSDPTSVVDPSLRVHNTNKLFVIDGSVMPSLPSGNINAAVMMIAEKGADSVKVEQLLSNKKSGKLLYFKQLLARVSV